MRRVIGRANVNMTSLGFESLFIVKENAMTSAMYIKITTHPCQVAGVQPQP